MSIEAGRIGDFTIANGASVSGAVYMSGAWTDLGVKLPLAWTAATLAFEFSDLAAPTAADADWWVWANGAADVALTVSANRYGTTPAGVMVPFFTPRTWMRLRSGTRAAPVNQGAERVLTVYGRRVF